MLALEGRNDHLAICVFSICLLLCDNMLCNIFRSILERYNLWNKQPFRYCAWWCANRGWFPVRVTSFTQCSTAFEHDFNE